MHPFRALPLCLLAALAVASASGWAQDRGAGAVPGRVPQGFQDRAFQDRAFQDRADRARPEMGNRRPDMSMGNRPEMSEPRMRPPRRDDALSDSIRSIERSTRGQVLSAERIQSDGRDVNRIKVMDGRGRVRVYMDDPQQRRAPPTRDDDN